MERGDDGAVTGYTLISEGHERFGTTLGDVGYDGGATFTKRMRRRLITLAPSFVPPNARTDGGDGGGGGAGGGYGGISGGLVA